MIRHLPTGLSLGDKEQLLKHFGAESVWESSKKSNYVFASFGTMERAKHSLLRLHQLELAGRRLVVEYSTEKVPVTTVNKQKLDSAATLMIKRFLCSLNAWNPSVDFYQPPSPHLKYQYPDINPEVIINIVHMLLKHKPFYIQVLHLMNKMSLDTPFNSNIIAINTFKEIFREYLFDMANSYKNDSESELSSDEIMATDQHPVIPVMVRRKHKLPKPSRKIPATLPPEAKMKRIPINQEEVFDITAVQEPKKICVMVSQDSLQKPVEEPEVIGEIGKYDKEEKPQNIEESISEPEQPIITRKELLKNRLSHYDMKILPVFKNYHPGQPSLRLYIKNLAKNVTSEDVERIYRLYVVDLTEEERQGFDVRVMQEGRMKGQAFVTFPSERIAQKALTETNGFMLKDRPMIVQFARAANKRTIE